MNKRVAIYVLYGIDCVPRYVGKTIELRRRFHLHCKKWDWVVGIKVIEWVDDHTWEERERFWIAEYRAKHTLLNIAGGGHGIHGHRLSEETRRKISEAVKGREPWNKGKTGVYTDQHREFLSVGAKIRGFSKSALDKSAEVRRGRPVADSVKKQISASLKGKPWSESRRKAQDGP